MTRVLFYSPYATWNYHTALEATWAHGLKARGVDVQFVTCNALSKVCDVYRENLNPRHEGACLTCQASTSALFASLEMPYDWLGTYLAPTVREEAESWAKGLNDHDLLNARWRGMDVGKWAAASAYNQYRTASLLLDDPHVVQTLRDLLVGTVLNLEAMDTLLDLHRPDTLVLLNGRFSGHWAAIELAKLKGIRFVSHERGFTKNTVRFSENARTHELGGMRELWEQWRDIPLDPAESAAAAQLLLDRRAGRNFSRMSFSPALQERSRVKQELSLDDRPLVAVFTSSDDETAAFPDRTEGAFPISNHFLPAVIELAQGRPDVQFVFRIHPNIQKAQAGTNQDALTHAEQIRQQAPANVRVVMPSDDVSSYTLMDIANVGMVYGSTAGLEMAACGKPVLCMAQSTYTHTGIAGQVNHPSELAQALDRALGQDVDLEVARIAMRWTYRYFHEYSVPFDLVNGPTDDGPASLTYTSLAQLAEGQHPILDRVCSYLAGQSPSVRPGITIDERQRDSVSETQSLALWLHRINGIEQPRAAV
ncbi:MAG: hypothetical protein ACI9F9_003163 [Candidatus Paceibacteria bacterium]|jgi:hypothetical protein